MKYHELVQTYFERSDALQWYWTVYVLVIGGIVAFSMFREQPNLARTILVTVLYAGFAYKNLGAIEYTTMERFALLSAVKDYPASGPDAADVKRVRDVLEPTLQPAEYGGFAGSRNFHLACDLMTIAVLWVTEWRRRQKEFGTGQGADLGRVSV